MTRNTIKRRPYVLWLAGPTGCGKTRLATSIDPDYWLSNQDLKWFDGYINQKVAILDDFRHSDVPFQQILRILDTYKLQLPVKGGFTTWNPWCIVVTCPRIPELEFKYKDQYDNGASKQYEDLEQVTRRCTEIRSWDSIRNCWTWIKGTDLIGQVGFQAACDQI